MPRECRVPDCRNAYTRHGAAHGYCVKHYNRWRRNGLCEAYPIECARPAVSHIGLCEMHEPEGILR